MYNYSYPKPDFGDSKNGLRWGGGCVTRRRNPNPVGGGTRGRRIRAQPGAATTTPPKENEPKPVQVRMGLSGVMGVQEYIPQGA